MTCMMYENLHIGILGPCSTADLNLSREKKSGMPKGMGGTPVNNLVNELLKRGFKVSVFSLDPSLKKNDFAIVEEGNLTLYYGTFRKSHRPRMVDFFSDEIRALKCFIKKANPDLLHAHWQYEYATAALKTKIPFVITCHDSPVNVLMHQPGLYRSMRLSMAWKNLRRSYNINAVSHYTAKANSIFTKAPIDVIPNFEPEWIFDLFTPRKFNGKLNIVMINNGFRGRKNVAVGLKAFKILQGKYGDNIEMNLYGGENGIGEEAQKFAESIDLKKGINYHGKIPFKDLMRELCNGDLFLHTALEESCPMVIIEAMAMGIPVVAGNNSGGIPEMLQGGGGTLTDVRNPDLVAEEVQKFMDQTVYSRTSIAANEIARSRFHPDVVVQKYIESYYNVLELNASQYA